MDRDQRIQWLKRELQKRIFILDGAMGTMLQARNLTVSDFGGEALEGCNEHLVLTRPDIILDIHRAYLAAGSDIIETNTFGGTSLVLSEYDLQDRARELNLAAVKLARKAADEFSTETKPRFVAGAMGPTTKAISVTGGVRFDELIENFYAQTLTLIEGGVDLLILETCQDTRNIKAAAIGIAKAFDRLGVRLPLIISGTMEPTGTMLAGQNAEALLISLQHLDLLAIGLNCATGPEQMTEHIHALHDLSPFAISCYPNAGLPDEEGCYPESPESLAAKLEKFVDHGWINLIGGCCGTTDKHIEAIARMVKGKKPRKIENKLKGRSFYSGIEIVESVEENRPLLVGERTNIIGSRIFKDMIKAAKWEEASEVARRQIKNGAQIIDVCLQTTDQDEKEIIPSFYEKLIRKIKAPIMIDSMHADAVELALQYSQGKAIINSINLEDGETRMAKVCPLVCQYGAALVVGTIDEDPHQAQALTRERKLAVAARSHKLLTEKYGMREEDIIFDPLVFPCATGDSHYIGSALETVEGLRLIKKRFPFSKTILGVSNVSFGLPPAAREVINSVFLYHCTLAGLDLAIVNAEKLERFSSIAKKEKILAENLLFNYPGQSHLGLPRDVREQNDLDKLKIYEANLNAVVAFYRTAKKKEAKVGHKFSLDERLQRYIIEGSQDGLKEDLQEKLGQGATALEIINGPLMQGMAEVGRQFNQNELIVAEVLQSAEAMKAAVSFLETYMNKEDVATKAKIVLATVKGDVHDIGKNLVEIILSNNGYEVINLGIKVPSEEIIEACKKFRPAMIGLSGLLVKSAQQMCATAADLHEAGIDVPILVGGAALSDKFTQTKIAPEYPCGVFYAKDAMSGLKLANEVILTGVPVRHSGQKQTLSPVGASSCSRYGACNRPQEWAPTDRQEAPPTVFGRSVTRVNFNLPIPPAPYLNRRVARDLPLKEIISFVNPQMLYAKHLGLKGRFEKKLAEKDPKATELDALIKALQKDFASYLKIKATWQFFEVEAKGNDILIFSPGKKEPLQTFSFPRQQQDPGLCLADYVLPASQENATRDHMAIFVTTAGEGIREEVQKLKEAGQYLKSHALAALTLELAEAAAEYLHQRIRADWGFADSKNITKMQLFQAKYRGKRYSFGYPACPDMDGQQGIWNLLGPEAIEVKLTEGMMMDPEASVSALVFHHPNCEYFSVTC